MSDEHALLATRETAATPEKIWDAWADPDKIAEWWGPAGFTSTVTTLDVKVGGTFLVVMHGPNGVDYPNSYVFDKVDRPHQLIYTNAGSKEFGLEPFQSVVDFKKGDEMTTITLKMRFTSEAEKQKHIQQFHADDGSRELLGRLAAVAEP